MRVALMIEGQEGVTWPQWCALADACEEHGIDTLFRSDHYISQSNESGNVAHDAWTTLAGTKIQLFDSRKHLSRTFGAVKGKPGEVSEIGPNSVSITAQGGRIEVFKLKPEGGKKTSTVEFMNEAGLSVGTLLGS